MGWSFDSHTLNRRLFQGGTGIVPGGATSPSSSRTRAGAAAPPRACSRQPRLAQPTSGWVSGTGTSLSPQLVLFILRMNLENSLTVSQNEVKWSKANVRRTFQVFGIGVGNNIEQVMFRQLTSPPQVIFQHTLSLGALHVKAMRLQNDLRRHYDFKEACATKASRLGGVFQANELKVSRKEQQCLRYAMANAIFSSSPGTIPSSSRRPSPV